MLMSHSERVCRKRSRSPYLVSPLGSPRYSQPFQWAYVSTIPDRETIPDTPKSPGFFQGNSDHDEVSGSLMFNDYLNVPTQSMDTSKDDEIKIPKIEIVLPKELKEPPLKKLKTSHEWQSIRRERISHSISKLEYDAWHKQIKTLWTDIELSETEIDDIFIMDLKPDSSEIFDRIQTFYKDSQEAKIRAICLLACPDTVELAKVKWIGAPVQLPVVRTSKIDYQEEALEQLQTCLRSLKYAIAIRDQYCSKRTVFVDFCGNI
jgi:hypothetical protein